MENVWEVRQGQGEQGELLADQHDEDGEKAHSDNCLERCLHCLSHVPCASLVAWIALLLGLGGVTGGLLIGADRTRDLLENDRLLWFMEYTLIGVVSGMFVIGTCLLLLGHYSSEPNSRHAFNTSRKNACARGLNIFMLLLSYILGFAWILTSAILAVPVAMLVLLIYLKDYKNFRCIDPKNYGLDYREVCDTNLERFANEGVDLLICYSVAYFSAVIIAASLVREFLSSIIASAYCIMLWCFRLFIITDSVTYKIHFLMCISANITHLRDARFATLNAYEEAEEISNSKQHNVNDTTM